MITLTYYIFNEAQSGFYHRGESAEFGTEYGDSVAEFENEADALYAFKDYLTDQAGAGWAEAEDITESGNFLGWGKVFRVTGYDDTQHMYSVDLNN